MIAKVRIAPVEQWCQESKLNSGHDLAGRPVRIITESLFHDDRCNGKAWLEPYEDSVIRAQEIGDLELLRGTVPYCLCEHMLEMN